MNASRLNPAAKQAGTQFTYPGGMEDWVDLGGWLYTEMVYLSVLRDKQQRKSKTLKSSSRYIENFDRLFTFDDSIRYIDIVVLYRYSDISTHPYYQATPRQSDHPVRHQARSD